MLGLDCPKTNYTKNSIENERVKNHFAIMALAISVQKTRVKFALKMMEQYST